MPSSNALTWWPRLALSLAALAAVAPPVRADTYPRQAGVDVLEYRFRLTLTDASDVIEGETVVLLRAAAAGLDVMELDLVGRSGKEGDRGMAVSEVTEGGTALRFEHTQDRLRIWLARAAALDERRSVTVRYRGIPATGLIVKPTKHGDRSFFSDNWPTKARQWLPVIDHPYDKAATEMDVTAPAHYQVVSNGLQVEETDLGGGMRRTRWRQSAPISPWLVTLGVARFAVDHRPAWKGLPIQTWVYAQDRDKGFYDFAEPTVAVLDFFDARIGPYAYEKLAQVQSNSVSGGMESATAIFYDDDAVTGTRTERWRNVIIHEIAHQWWGNAVTERDWDDVWLSEGFATYFTLLFIEHAYGRDAFVEGLQRSRDSVRSFNQRTPNYRIVHDNLADMEQVLTGQIYQKGGWTLHMLRGLVGDGVFWRGIRDYYARYRNGHASTADFRRAMEAAWGRDLAWFFDQWLYRRGGLPHVKGTWRYDATARAVRLDLEQAQPEAPYRMPVDVRLTGAGQTVRVERIELADRRHSFTIPAERKPEAVVLDPDTWLLVETDLTRVD